MQTLQQENPPGHLHGCYPMRTLRLHNESNHQSCEKSVTAKIVVLLDEQQVSLKIDDTLLTKMFGDVISIDDKTLAQKLLFLEDFAVTYNTDTLFQILTCKILILCVHELDVWRFNI